MKTTLTLAAMALLIPSCTFDDFVAGIDRFQEGLEKFNEYSRKSAAQYVNDGNCQIGLPPLTNKNWDPSVGVGEY